MTSGSVFISHRSTERGIQAARRLAELLKEKGIDAFLDLKDLDAGDIYASEIQNKIRGARVVVVLFEKEMTSWLHFEAACAFFDRKLIPVSVEGAEVPPPYDQIQQEAGGDDGALERVVEQVARRLGSGHGGVARGIRELNRSFAWGAWLVVVLLAAVLVPWGGWGEGQGILFALGFFGSLVVGGQFFLSLAFSRMVASPSFRERVFAFRAVRHLMLVWIPMVLVPATIGVIWAVSLDSVEPWAFLALAAYSSAVFIFGLGYFVMKESIELDSFRKMPDRVARLRLLANLLFIGAFFGLAWVMSLVVLQAVPAWLAELAGRTN